MILVTGGAGYIGSHIVKTLVLRKIPCVVLDNLCSGIRQSVPVGVPFVNADFANLTAIKNIFKNYRIDTVIHLAASISPAESMQNPFQYYKNNTVKSLFLWNMCAAHKVKNIIFSSTAAVYGNVSAKKVKETDPVAPISPYGKSKLMAETMLVDVATVNKISYVILRYFNVVGVDKTIPYFLNRKSEHLLQVCLDVASGKKKFVPVYRKNYQTPDGTGVRDYIHVLDIAQAHIDALKYLSGGGKSGIFNAGYGKGTSVLEMIRIVEKETKRTIPFRYLQWRLGDSPSVIADAGKIVRVLKWKPKYKNLWKKDIMLP